MFSGYGWTDMARNVRPDPNFCQIGFLYNYCWLKTFQIDTHNRFYLVYPLSLTTNYNTDKLQRP